MQPAIFKLHRFAAAHHHAKRLLYIALEIGYDTAVPIAETFVGRNFLINTEHAFHYAVGVQFVSFVFYVDTEDPKADIVFVEYVFGIKVNGSKLLLKTVDLFYCTHSRPVFFRRRMNIFFLYLGGGTGFIEKISLEEICLKRLQNGKLFGGFNALQTRIDGICLGKLDQVADEAVIIRILLDIRNEAAVDLDFVYIKLLEISEVGISRSEIVDREADTIGLDLFDPLIEVLVLT